MTIAFLVLAAATVAAVLLYFANPFGGGGQLNARDILTRALTAFEKPDVVGLHSYQGVAQYTTKRTASGNSLDDPSIVLAKIPIPPTPESSTEFRVWYAQPNRFRLEFETTTAGKPPDRTVGIADGKSMWEYMSASNAYTTQPQKPSDLQNPDSDFPSIFGLGANAGSIKDLLAQINSSGKQYAEVVGTDKVLGRSVYVIEVSPQGGGGISDATPAYPRSTTRIYLDKKFLFVLGTESTLPGGVTISTRFTQIEFNKPIEDSEFVFTPPPGATEVSAEALRGPPGSSGGSGSSSDSGDMGQQLDLPAGFLLPSYYVPGYQGRNTYSAYDKDLVTYVAGYLIRQDGGKGYISAQELRGKGDLPEELKTGDKIAVRGNDAWLESRDRLLHLAWQEGDLSVYLVSRGLSKDELLRVAGSMQPSTGNSSSGPILAATPVP